MQDLHLVGFTTDRRHLIFSARRGAKSGGFVVPVDDELLAAIDELRSADTDEADDGAEADEEQLSPPPQARVEARLSVREIQARLRAGDTVADVAKRAAVDDQWVERFAPPVRAEQRRVVERAQAAPLVRARGGPSAVPLRRAVAIAMADRGVAFTAEGFESAWAARLVGQDRWEIEFAYVQRGRTRVVSWTYDAGTDTLTTSDRTASQIGYVSDDDEIPPVASTVGATPAGVFGSGLPGAPTSPTTAGRGRSPRAAEKTTAQTSSARKTSTSRKAVAAKKTAAEKAASRKAAAKKAAAKKAAAKKAAAKKVAAKKAAAKKAAAKKATAKKAAAKKATAKKATAKKAVAKKATAKKATAKKAVAKKAAARKATAKRATAKKKTAARSAAAGEPAAAAPPAPTEETSSVSAAATTPEASAAADVVAADPSATPAPSASDPSATPAPSASDESDGPRPAGEPAASEPDRSEASIADAEPERPVESDQTDRDEEFDGADDRAGTAVDDAEADAHAPHDGAAMRVRSRGPAGAEGTADAVAPSPPRVAEPVEPRSPRTADPIEARRERAAGRATPTAQFRSGAATPAGDAIHGNGRGTARTGDEPEAAEDPATDDVGPRPTPRDRSSSGRPRRSRQLRAR